MTSFISALSIFVLALVSGCFTLPITENPLSDTSSPFYNDVTTDKLFGERMVFDDATMSSTSAGIQRSSDELMGFETSSMFEDATREPRMFEDVTQEPRMFEDATREPRMFEDVTQEPHMFEDATREPRMLVDMATDESSTFMPTTGGWFRQQGEMKDSSVVTVEPTTKRVEFIPRDFEMESQNETEVATESSHSKREFDDSVFTTSKSVTGMRSSEQRFATIEPERSSMEMQMDFTTDGMSLFTSTSSAVAPELYTREPSTTRKYTGLLADKEDQEDDKEHNDEEHKKLHSKHGKEETEMEEHKQEGDKEVEEGRRPEKHDEDNFEKNVEVAEPKDLIKKRPSTFRQANIESDDGIQYPKAIYDQDAWKNIPKNPSDFAILDETSDVVTTFSKLDSLYTAESHTKQSKLNQGEESSRAE